MGIQLELELEIISTKRRWTLADYILYFKLQVGCVLQDLVVGRHKELVSTEETTEVSRWHHYPTTWGNWKPTSVAALLLC